MVCQTWLDQLIGCHALRKREHANVNSALTNHSDCLIYVSGKALAAGRSGNEPAASALPLRTSITQQTRMNISKLCYLFLAVAISVSMATTTLCASPLQNSEKATTTSVQGRVVIPKDVSEGIKTDGITLDKVIIKLEGNYKHPRRPFPANWSEMTREERKQWSSEFKKSDAFKEHERKAEEARAKRPTFTTQVTEDGSFTFENIKPAWYQLRVMIMHANAKGEPTFELARGYALRQFIIKDAEKPHRLGNLELKLKNVLWPGDTAPDWEATAYDGSKFKLSDFRGRYVLIDFWATWCGPCLAEIPNLESAHKDFGGERFETIGLSVDKTMDLAVEHHEKKPSAYRQGFLGQGERYQKIREAWGIEAIPAIWLIGPDGKLVARDLRGEALREAVRKALEVSPEKD